MRTVRRPRRRPIVFLVVLLGVTPAIHAQRSPAPAMFRGDTAHTGVYAAADLPSYGGLRWTTRLDGPIRGSPTLSGGALYVATTAGTVVALDRATGSSRWRYSAGASVGSTPAVASGLVIVPSGDGRVHALDAATGRLRWRTAATRAHPFPWGHESGDLYLSSPVIAGGAVYVGNGDGGLYRLDLATGRVVWRFDTEAPVRSSPAYGNGIVYFGSSDGSVYAVRAASGALLWKFDTEGTALLSQNFGFDRRTVQSSPALDAATVYIGARDGYFYAIDRATGKERWRFNHEVSWVNGSPALAGGLAIVGTSDGHFVQGVDTASGAERWRFMTENIVWGSAAVVGATAYLGEANGTLYAFDVATGVERWRWRGGGRFFSTPVAADSTLYVGADDGTVRALALTAGPRLDRVVFWDSTVTSLATFAAHEVVRRMLEPRGYRPVGTSALAELLARPAESARRTSIVFAMDVLPAGLDAPFRAFLDRGGRVVWLGLPPGLWPPDSATGQRTLKGVDRPGAERLLGVKLDHANFDLLGATPTELGRCIGLEGWLLGNWSAEPTGVEVLARDSDGRAVAWRKGGLVRLPGGFPRDALPPDFGRTIQNAAEAAFPCHQSRTLPAMR
ncbi:MAG: PQQ-binding-like beta-propeller repeat protein [Gemmatimonadales bacterium]|nr:PQQ-binding-like beta-propeller repeat protein [Gemmatimonadales bacterium]